MLVIFKRKYFMAEDGVAGTEEILHHLNFNIL